MSLERLASALRETLALARVNNEQQESVLDKLSSNSIAIRGVEKENAPDKLGQQGILETLFCISEGLQVEANKQSDLGQRLCNTVFAQSEATSNY